MSRSGCKLAVAAASAAAAVRPGKARAGSDSHRDYNALFLTPTDPMASFLIIADSRALVCVCLCIDIMSCPHNGIDRDRDNYTYIFTPVLLGLFWIRDLREEMCGASVVFAAH